MVAFSISNENTCSGYRVRLGKDLWDHNFLIWLFIDCVLKEFSGFSFSYTELCSFVSFIRSVGLY